MSEINLNQVVESMAGTFVSAGRAYLLGFALGAPGLGVAGAWFVRVLIGPLIEWVLVKLTEWSVMRTFFYETAIRKHTLALDYIKAVERKERLRHANNAYEFEIAEQVEIEAFSRFVTLK